MESVLQSPATLPSTRPANGMILWSGAALVLLWLLPGLLTLGAMDLREVLEGGGWLFALLCGLALSRKRPLSHTPLGRLWLAILFVFTALLVSPAFHRSVGAGTFDGSGNLVNGVAFFSAFSALLFCVWARWARAVLPATSPPSEPLSRVEALLERPGTRVQLALALALAVAAGVALSGLSMKTLPLRIAMLGAFALGLQPLLAFARLPSGPRVIQGACAAVLLAVLISGGFRYVELKNVIAEGAAMLDKNNVPEATRIHNRARQLNKTLYSKGLEVEIETSWALFYERLNLPVEALQRWQQVADIQRIDRAKFPPVLRAQTRIGDSITVWRRAVFEGFDGVGHPEIMPGIVGLAEISGDLRAKLLSALLAWEHNLPEAERRKRLEEVQRVAPLEPTSYNLLNRMGANLPPAPLWLPDALIVGRKATLYSELGHIGELGEVETLVLLDKGQWEIAIKASGVPLHEIWPIIRVELNGHEIGRSQVTRTELHEVPFVCDINRGNLYRLKIVFQNKQADFQSGRKEMRGLGIAGIVFRKAKLQE
ncbi:MAG TPA: hypothetical protein VEJ63_15210 [Planctomycetota bacterium]|nr:hypothetical protein [Planctomycetota bacterium]